MVKAVICFLTLTGVQAFAESNNLAQQLIELRAQVQTEADELDAQKKSLNASIQSLTIEKGDLESKKKLMKLQNTEMKKALLKKEKIIGGLETKGMEGYAEAVNEGLSSLLSYIEVAIPFKVEERKTKIEKLKKKFDQKEITLAEYLEKYWSSLQDEIRLSESVEIQNDNVQIGDKEYQVKVLKFGMYQMYFKTYEGKLGYASQENGNWKFSLFEDSNMEKGVELLMAAKEKQIKGGNFNLPIVQHANSSKQYSKNASYEVKNVF